MGKFAKQRKTGTPLFDGSNYTFWHKDESLLEAQGIKIWQSIENGYKVPHTILIDATELAEYNNNSKAKNHLLGVINESVFNKVMHFPYEKEMWDKL